MKMQPLHDWMGAGNVSLLLQALKSVCVWFGISELPAGKLEMLLTVSLQKPFTWKMIVSLTSTDFPVDQEGHGVLLSPYRI